MEDMRILEGSIVRKTPSLPIEEIEKLLSSDDILKKGLVFLGGARQGKTNVMMKVVSDIFSVRKPEDIVVIFDVKGDYRNMFFADGDMVLSPTEDDCIWNIFEELKILPFGSELENKVNEVVDYLYYGQASSREPFWNNAAKYITYCFIMYMLLEADANDDDSFLNHDTLCRLIDGRFEEADFSSIYESYREILQSYDKFRAAGMFLPPPESGSNMGGSIMTEVLVMRQKLFVGNFGKKKNRKGQHYISPGTIRWNSGSGVLFLEYNPLYQSSCASVFRCFVDMLISTYLDKNKKDGRLYLILDELALLPELNRLDQALNLGAQHGIRIAAGLQEIEQMRHGYRSAPYLANVILGAFQNQVVFNSDSETTAYISKRLGNALIQRRYLRAGGGLGTSEPIMVPAIEQYEFDEFKPGDAVVHFSGKRAFKTHFPLYEKKVEAV